MIFDWISYIPSLIFLSNFGLVIYLLYSPEQVLGWYQQMLDEVERQKNLDDDENENEEEFSFQAIKQQGIGNLFKDRFRIFKHIYKSVEDQKESLKDLQNDIGRINYRLLQLRSLYLWKSPQHSWFFLFVSFSLFLVFFLIPFRYLWGFGGNDFIFFCLLY